MASLNKLFLLGNLTRDPQLKYLPSQTAVVEFGLAVNRRFKLANGDAGEEVTFVDCVAFGKTAEVINQYLTKGKPILIEGRLKFESWEDKRTGDKRSKLKVIVESFQFIASRDSDAAPARQDERRGDAPSRGPATRPAEGTPPTLEDDIPF